MLLGILTGWLCVVLTAVSLCPVEHVPILPPAARATLEPGAWSKAGPGSVEDHHLDDHAARPWSSDDGDPVDPAGVYAHPRAALATRCLLPTPSARGERPGEPDRPLKPPRPGVA